MGHLVGKDVYRELGQKIDGLTVRVPWSDKLEAVLRRADSRTTRGSSPPCPGLFPARPAGEGDRRRAQRSSNVSWKASVRAGW